MRSALEETTEVQTDPLLQHILFIAGEYGEWDVPTLEEAADDDELFDGVRAANVKNIELNGDGVILHGEFEYRIVVDYIRGSWHHPPEVKTEKEEAFFTVEFYWDDGGHGDVVVEV
jgi:hypothetical protein